MVNLSFPSSIFPLTSPVIAACTKWPSHLSRPGHITPLTNDVPIGSHWYIMNRLIDPLVQIIYIYYMILYVFPLYILYIIINPYKKRAWLGVFPRCGPMLTFPGQAAACLGGRAVLFFESYLICLLSALMCIIQVDVVSHAVLIMDTRSLDTHFRHVPVEIAANMFVVNTCHALELTWHTWRHTS